MRPGDKVRVQPSGRESRVARIVTMDGDSSEAVAGQSVTLTLADEIDVSRGDVLVAAPSARRGRRPVRGDARLDATTSRCCPGRPYLLKIGTRTVTATVTELKYRVNVNTLEHVAAKTLDLNEIGVCNLDARPADRLRRLQRQPRHGRLHPDRSADERTRSAPA